MQINESEVVIQPRNGAADTEVAIGCAMGVYDAPT
jgi:hypothetical protein